VGKYTCDPTAFEPSSAASLRKKALG